MSFKSFCFYLVGFILVIIVCTAFYFTCFHQTSETTTSCVLPDAKEGQCVELSSCSSVNLNNHTDPESFNDFRQRSENCKSFGAKFICCEHHLFEGIALSKSVLTVDKIIPSNPLKKHENFKLFDMENCGKTSTSLMNRIANGDDAELFEFPWAVRLGFYVHGEIKYECGGTLISEYYVLTAAHCWNSEVDLETIRLGEYDDRTEKDCIFHDKCADPVQDIEVDRDSFIIHPEYDATKIINDIGLIRLKEPAKLTQNNIRTICLPFDENAERVSQNYTVVGWGATTNTSSYPVLQKATLPHYDSDRCQEKFAARKTKFKIKISDNQICAGGVGLIDACKGDSGMALQAEAILHKDPQMVQYGIVSFGVAKCGKIEDASGVYTKVSKYLTWILDNMKQ